MPYRKQKFTNDEIYHIVSRGIDDNLIFKDINDYYRGVFSIYEFNTINPITIQRRREARARFKKARGGPSSTTDSIVEDIRDRMVDIIAFCFMPNHIHLLLKQLKDNGITKFMSKVGTGYAGYFNRKYKRKGYVFQNRFKDVHIEDDSQLLAVFNYIHANPISLIEPNFKEQGIKNYSTEEIVKFLENYKWSSYKDYIGEQNFPSVTERDFLLEAIGGAKGCKEVIKNWVINKEIKKANELFLEL
ncbi:MAG: putative transposase [Parcubacteria group bacterium Licking1014_1]|nr:MAG: putative transposase [Parcubacteria group bacterium Licking1014_1]